MPEKIKIVDTKTLDELRSPLLAFKKHNGTKKYRNRYKKELRAQTHQQRLIQHKKLQIFGGSLQKLFAIVL